MTAPLSPERLTEVKNLLRYESSISFHSARAKESMLLVVAEVDRLNAEASRLASDRERWRRRYYEESRTYWDAELPPGGECCADCGQPVESEPCEEHHPATVAERLSKRVAELEAERAKYVGKEPTIAEEMQYVGSCLMAVYDLVNAAKKRGHEVVTTAEVEQAASGDWPRDSKDNRRSIYMDGKGNAWIDQSTDEDGAQWVVPVDALGIGDEPRDDVRERTGSLREIGRCW